MEGSRTARSGLGWVGNIRPVSVISPRQDSALLIPSRRDSVPCWLGMGMADGIFQKNRVGEGGGGPLSLNSS